MSGIGSATHPIPLYLFGESNVCTFADRVYRSPATGRSYLFRALYSPGVRARDLVDGDGRLGPALVRALEGARLIVRHGDDLEAAHAASSPHWRWIRDLEERSDVAPPIVLAAGMMDMHEVSVAIEEPDIELPPELLAAPTTAAICRTTLPGALAHGEAVARYAATLTRLRAALRRLRAMGFTRLGVLGLAPVTRDTEDAARATELAGFRTVERPDREAFRTKGLLICNAALAQAARDENAVFIDRWTDFIAGDGLVRPGVLRDFVHVNAQASESTAAAIVAQLAEPDIRDLPSAPNAPDASDDEPGGDETTPALRTAIANPFVAALHALAAPRRGARILDVGGTSVELAYECAGDGAHVTKIVSGTGAAAAGTAYDGRRVRLVTGDAMLADDPAAYDTIVASGVESARSYAGIAAALRPHGLLLVRPLPVAPAAAGEPVPWVRPSRLRQRLSAAFPHVLVWLGAPDDVRGSLGRAFSLAQARAATAAFAVASHRPIDAAALLARITTEAAPDETEMQVRVSEAYAPRRVVRGQRFFAELTLANEAERSLSSFAPYPFRFAPRWFDHAGEPAGSDQLRAPVAPAARPGESVRYAFEVEAPAAPGRYTLRLGIVQELVRWYTTSADLAVTVL